jgi:hypothetical protein
MPNKNGGPASGGNRSRARDNFIRDTANISVVGPANKGGVGDYAEISHILSRRKIRPGVGFETHCPYCKDTYQRWVCEELVPDALLNYISPSLRSEFEVEKSLFVMPLPFGEAFFYCFTCSEESGARLHVPDHPTKFRAEGLMAMFEAQDKEVRS